MITSWNELKSCCCKENEIIFLLKNSIFSKSYTTLTLWTHSQLASLTPRRVKYGKLNESSNNIMWRERERKLNRIYRSVKSEALKCAKCCGNSICASTKTSKRNIDLKMIESINEFIAFNNLNHHHLYLVRLLFPVRFFIAICCGKFKSGRHHLVNGIIFKYVKKLMSKI